MKEWAWSDRKGMETGMERIESRICHLLVRLKRTSLRYRIRVLIERTALYPHQLLTQCCKPRNLIANYNYSVVNFATTANHRKRSPSLA